MAPEKAIDLSYDTPNAVILNLVLFVICFSTTSNYFCYHAPSAIADEYSTFYKLDTKQFGTLFTIYSAPNVILVFISGIFIDKYGLKVSSLLFNCLIIIGMFICAVTPFPSAKVSSDFSYICLLVGRLFLGLGGESICACGATMISKWFTHSGHLNAAMAINQAGVQLFGSSAAFILLPHLHSITLSQWMCVLIALLSLTASFTYIYFEMKYTEYLIDVNSCDVIDPSVKLKPKKIEIPDVQPDQENINETAINPSYQWTDSIEENTLMAPISNINLISSNLNFPILFWLLMLHICFLSPLLYTFTAFGPLYLEETFKSTSAPQSAGDATSLLYMGMMAAPFTGYIIDNVGHRAFIQLLSSLFIPIQFLLLHYRLIDPFLSFVSMGLCYSITEANGMAMISIIVPQDKQGTAFGLYGCFISIALLIEPAAVGWLRQTTGSFSSSLWLFIILSLMGVIFALLVFVYDRMTTRLLSRGKFVYSLID